jgi:hypothetical protein
LLSTFIEIVIGKVKIGITDGYKVAIGKQRDICQAMAKTKNMNRKIVFI